LERKRRTYTSEENLFLYECFKSLRIENRRQKWKEIAKAFNSQFPSIIPPRKYKELENHFMISLNPSLNRGKFTEEEDNFILNFVSKSGHKWKTIAQILRRDLNDIKNHFNRELSKEMMKTEIKSKEPQIDVQDETESLIEGFHALNWD
jgi:myb proto-oncogene protein